MSWSSVFNRSAASCPNTSGTCPTECFNVTSPDQLATGAAVADLIPYPVSSLADATGYWADQLARRLAAKVFITSTSSNVFALELRRGTRVDTTTWTYQNNKGAYPMLVDYATPSDSGTAVRFEDVTQAIDWLVQRFA